MTRFRLFDARMVLAASLLALAPVQSARAVGGDGVNLATQVNKATQDCQKTIASAGAAYAAKSAAAMNACLDAIVKCDQQTTEAKADACRRALVIAGSGKCAKGKVDEGVVMTGNGAAAHADALSTSKAVLLAEMRKYTTAIQKKCFTPVGVDLGSVAQGLGFSPTPGTKLALADATNQSPGGVQCLANGIALKTHPLANDMTGILDDFGGKCSVAELPATTATSCTLDTDCGATKGRCGAIAKVFRDDITRCATPPLPVAVCGNGTAESPEACDDGNVLSGDGCSGTCTIEPPPAVVCGDGISVEPEACDDGNLSNGDGCSSLCAIEPPSAAGFPATGQTTCWNTSGTVIACAGTGQDGELQFGATLAYTDNGDGTITDNNTGLVWEKLSDDGSIHDKDAAYTWANAFAVKIAALNAGPGFAGHTDWRVPNRKELESILNLQNISPAVSVPCHTGCTPGATVLTGSCTVSGYYWSSSTYAGSPSNAWLVGFNAGIVNASNKTLSSDVRGVRGGS